MKPTIIFVPRSYWTERYLSYSEKKYEESKNTQDGSDVRSYETDRSPQYLNYGMRYSLNNKICFSPLSQNENEKEEKKEKNVNNNFVPCQLCIKSIETKGYAKSDDDEDEDGNENECLEDGISRAQFLAHQVSYAYSDDMRELHLDHENHPFQYSLDIHPDRMLINFKSLIQGIPVCFDCAKDKCGARRLDDSISDEEFFFELKSHLNHPFPKLTKKKEINLEEFRMWKKEFKNEELEELMKNIQKYNGDLTIQHMNTMTFQLKFEEKNLKVEDIGIDNKNLFYLLKSFEVGPIEDIKSQKKKYQIKEKIEKFQSNSEIDFQKLINDFDKLLRIDWKSLKLLKYLVSLLKQEPTDNESYDTNFILLETMLEKHISVKENMLKKHKREKEWMTQNWMSIYRQSQEAKTLEESNKWDDELKEFTKKMEKKEKKRIDEKLNLEKQQKEEKKSTFEKTMNIAKNLIQKNNNNNDNKRKR